MLMGASLDFGAESDVMIVDADSKWSLSLSIDPLQEELIFKVNMQPLHWLAIGLAGDFMDKADVIRWYAGTTDEVESIADEFTQLSRSAVHDEISVNGIIFENPNN